MRPPPTVDMSPDLDTLAELGQSDETVRIAVLGMQGVGKSGKMRDAAGNQAG